MSSRSRKRSRAVADENRADCPFAVAVVATPAVEGVSRKRKRGDEDDRSQIQVSPFEPRGQFKTHSSMDLAYTVEPWKEWLEMTRYNSFVLNNVKYHNEDFVYIANDTTIERQMASSKDFQSTDYWVAKILEVRASDEHHVYARIYWMYSPDEIPPNTLDGKKIVSGRQPYHGQNELIASNHMDVINVVSVATHAPVNQWVESDDEEVQDALYWRQAFDCRTAQLSSVDLTCKCKSPANPDQTLIGCTNAGCEEWLHFACLQHDVLMRVYARLGTDKPHEPRDEDEKDGAAKMEADEKPSTAAVCSTTPTEIKGEDSQPTISVKEAENGDSLPVKKMDGITPKTTESPIPGSPAVAADKPSRSSSVKRGRPRKNTVDSKPYDGLFEATLKLDEGPTVWRIKDLRTGVASKCRGWTERAHCLVCGTVID
ncbi:ebs-bah-phd domain-containing protein [Ophiocordyceps camponoti-floridani]|uniref:Ebs-bah-phd domain-containing protein n=1 Tax=Ophiocordyceps camponoti-floridani TaxID=2030778 RepID=A0A8H4Q759_9HYPO|nr:ebs-bah-phd domain-containing protein [Ophiocordyceps camponoti-floridani]